MPALSLLSGGLDSLVASTHAARYGGLALAVTFDYGQRAAKKEREASAAIAAALGAGHRVVALALLKEVGGSALTDERRSIPEADDAHLDDPQTAASVWVPNRNGLFINAAACIAEAEGLDRIIVGFNREEAVTFPDNRLEYIEALNRALSFSLNVPVRVESPTSNLDKAGIVRLGLDLEAPLHEVWSCYTAGPAHCFQCESCLRLKRALEAEGIWEKIAPQLSAR